MRAIAIFLICIFLCFDSFAVNTRPEEISKTLDRAVNLYNGEDYQNALELFQGILNDPESFKSGGLKVMDKIVINRLIGRCFISLNDYSSGLTHLLRVDSIRNEFKILFDPESADDAKDIAYCYFKLENQEKGDEWGNHYALLLQQTNGSFNNSTQAKAWLFLYRMHLINGDQVQAVKYGKKCIDTGNYEELFDNESEVIDFMVQLCTLLYNLNDVSTALKFATNLEAMLSEYIPNSLAHLRICNLLTVLNLNSPEEAQTYLNKAFEIAATMEESGELNGDMLAAINNLSLFQTLEDREAALKTYEFFLEKSRSLGHERYAYYAIGLNGYAFAKGYDDPESPTLFNEAYSILAGIEGSDISKIMTVGLNWIMSLAYNPQTALEIPFRAIEITKELNRRLMKAFNNLSEGKRNLYWQQVSTWYKIIVPEIVYTCDQPELWKLLYDCLLETRGILLNSSISLATVIKESNDPELKAMYAQYSSINDSSGSLRREYISDALESRLLSESKKYNDFLAPFKVNSDDVKSRLNNSDVAIEFVRYDYNAFENILAPDTVANEPDIRYLALILDPSSPTPLPIELCKESDLSKGGIGNLYNTIWRPLEPLLDGVERIYFSPDGALFSLPLEYARMPDGKFIWERYDCRRLSSTRELVRQTQNKGNGIALFGGMKYDMTVNEMVIDSKKYRDVTEEMARERGTRDELHATRPLPGSLRESELIHNTAQKFLKDTAPISLFKGKNATEAAFKSISGHRNRIIHIATHGFYNGSSSVDPITTNFELGEESETTAMQAERKMMSHSGLLFSGVDNVRYDEPIPNDVEDGILDSYEISTLDLHGTDLVTLSACRTALGQLSGDGVFGLQRGFKKAGVNSIMMSLWNIDDDATCAFMTEFYRNYLEPGTSATGDKHKSLRRAQEAVMANPKWRNEEFWAGFILLDDF